MCASCVVPGEGESFAEFIFSTICEMGVLGGLVISLMIDPATSELVLAVNHSNGTEGEDYRVKINYCPICGKELKN